MTTDSSEKGLENLIVTAMTGRPWPDAPSQGEGIGWLNGDSKDYAREWCIDLVHLSAFLTLHSAQDRGGAGFGE